MCIKGTSERPHYNWKDTESKEYTLFPSNIRM